MAPRPDLTPDDEGASRLLPWVVAVMAFLAALAAAGGVALDKAARDWRTGLSGSLTVEVPAPAQDAESQDRRAAAGVEALLGTAGVREARVHTHAELAALLEPWLGCGGAIDALPLPRLVDVTLDEGHLPDLDFLAKRIADAAPGARLDDHKLWLDRLTGLARATEGAAAAAIGLIGLALAAVVVFATRAAFAAHADTNALLHLIGARDGQIAGHFQRRAMLMALKGGLLGLALAAVTLGLLAQFSHGLELPFGPRALLAPAGLVASALIPVAAAAVAWLTARLTVLRALSRMP
jgi:cell division transport system permease protein